METPFSVNTDQIRKQVEMERMKAKILKGALLVQKAMAIAEIAINLQRQISAVNTMASMISALPGVGMIVGNAFRVAGLIAAIGGAAAATAKVAAAGGSIPGFIDGGFTQDSTGTPGGFYNKPTFFPNRNYTVSEDGRPEFVINNRALQVPAVANFANMLNAVQRSGNYTGISGAAPGQSAAGPMIDISAMIAEMRALREEVRTQGQKPMVINHRVWDDYDERITEIKRSTSL